MPGASVHILLVSCLFPNLVSNCSFPFHTCFAQLVQIFSHLVHIFSRVGSHLSSVKMFTSFQTCESFRKCWRQPYYLTGCYTGCQSEHAWNSPWDCVSRVYDSVLDRQAARVQHGKIVHVKPGAWTNMDEYQTLSESDINQIGQQFEDIANACKCNKYPQIANEKAQSGAVTLLTFPNQNFWPAWHDSLQDISVSYDAQGPKHNHQRDLCSNVWALTDTAGHLFPSISSRPWNICISISYP